MDLEFQLQYKNLLVHHLEKEEIEHELAIRAVQFEKTESRSAIQRRLRDRLKEERDRNIVDVDFQRLGTTADEEIKIIDTNLETIRKFLENKTRFEGVKDSLKTRLVHYFSRARRAQENTEDEEDLTDLDKIVSTVRELMNSYFSPFSHNQVIRDEITQQIVKSLSNFNIALTPGKKNPSRKSPEKNIPEDLSDDAGGDSQPTKSSSRRKLKSVRETGGAQALLPYPPMPHWYPYAFPPVSIWLASP